MVTLVLDFEIPFINSEVLIEYKRSIVEVSTGINVGKIQTKTNNAPDLRSRGHKIYSRCLMLMNLMLLMFLNCEMRNV